MHHPAHMPRPSPIVAASSVFGPVLGELPDFAIQWMNVPEPIKNVQVTSQVLFHWARHGTWLNDMRSDTGTYQWLAEAARKTVVNPYALKNDARPHRFHVIGKVRPPSSQHATIRFLRLVVRYVPSGSANSGSPEMWLDTYIPHTPAGIRRYLRGAWIASATRGLSSPVKLAK
jgi:hypothetical protein